MITRAIVLAAISLLCIGAGAVAADRAIDEAYSICGEHRAAPLPGQLGPPKGFAAGWEKCADVERLYLQDRATDREKETKDRLDALVRSRGAK